MLLLLIVLCMMSSLVLVFVFGIVIHGVDVVVCVVDYGDVVVVVMCIGIDCVCVDGVCAVVV